MKLFASPACSVRSHSSGARPNSTNVFIDRKRIEKLRYMHRNPVKRGLVASPEQWRWSSYRHYLLNQAGPVRVNVAGERFR